MATRRILATSGGFVATDRWGVLRPGLVSHALRFCGKERPRLTFVLTASGDAPTYLASMYDAMRGWSCDLAHLALFPQPNADPRELLLSSDVVWVGGGSVANLLSVWRTHGLDEVFAEAWDSGVLLAGVSAGSLCWHVGGPTDSFGPELRPVTNGLALLPYGNGVHYDTEEQRRPLLHRLVGEGVLPTSYATDDGVGIVYEGTEPVEVLVDEPTVRGGAYLIEREADGVVETRLAIGRL